MLLMSEPPLLFHPDALGAVLVQLRTKAHLSQRVLAKYSGVSNTTISGLEAGVGAAPHPSMLQNLGRGLATNGLGVVDEQRAEAAYLTLMQAAGYVPTAPIQVTILDMREALMAKGFRSDESHIVEQILDDMADKHLDERARQQTIDAVAAMMRALRAASPDR